MMKSPLYEHGEKLRQKAMKLSKESSGRNDAPDYDNPEVVKLLEKAKKADKSHGSDSPVKGYVSDAQRKAVYASKADGGKGSPAKMKSPLHAPVTATQDITSDMYYQPRNEMDYSTMVEAAGKMGGKLKKKTKSKTKVKSDPVEDHSRKAINVMNEINATNKKNNKWFEDNTELKNLPDHGAVRVDKNGNIYSPFGQKGDNSGVEGFTVKKYPIIGNTNKDLKDFDPTKTLSIMDVKDLKDNKEKPTFKGS